MSSPWFLITCARCDRPGVIAYRRTTPDGPCLGRELALIAQSTRSGWRMVGDLVVCGSYPCQALACRWEAEDIAASLGNPPPFRTGATATRDLATRAEARSWDRPLSTAPWWRRALARLFAPRGGRR